ncbi:MAG: hypothetical protein ABI783_06830 [Actinomycetota bacterium]
MLVELADDGFESTLRARASAANTSVSELVNEAVRAALAQGGAEIAVTARHKKSSSASFERLAEALKRRRLGRHRTRPPRT